jgi:FdhD protein
MTTEALHFFKNLLSETPDQSGVKSLNIQRADVRLHPISEDHLAIEEPLEIRIEFGPENLRVSQSISITMRTPGFDFELAVGFLFTEGMIHQLSDIRKVHYCGPDLQAQPITNIVKVELSPEVRIDAKRLTRHFYTSSSCGVCGKSSIEALKTQSQFELTKSPHAFNASVIHQLPNLLRNAQGIFDSTGGLHASALFSQQGELLLVREDVGRHNALDKVMGHAFLKGLLPLSETLLLVSGRASFELIQKASMGGVGILAAVGAPSSLAVELAQEVGMGLLGFVRNDRFNIYAGAERVCFQGES